MTVNIVGLATANPDHLLTQDDALTLAQQVLASDADQAKLLKVLYRRSGIKTRRTFVSTNRVRQWLQIDDSTDAASGACGPANGSTCTVAGSGATTRQRMELYQEFAPQLAREAAQAALERAGWKPSDVTHLVTVSCSGFSAPGVDTQLMLDLGMRPTVQRTHVGYMACHGALNGLRVARSYCHLEPDARVLLCAVEVCSLHYFAQWDPARFMANVIFGDGAAALALQAEETANGQTGRPWRLAANGSCLFPDSTDILEHRVGDYGFEVVLSARLPDAIQANLRPWAEAWLAGHGLKIEDVGSWAIHPGGPRVLSSVEEALGLPGETTVESREVLSQFGNMSSATVLFVLQRLMRRDAPRPCVAMAFGPGLIVEAALFL